MNVLSGRVFSPKGGACKLAVYHNYTETFLFVEYFSVLKGNIHLFTLEVMERMNFVDVYSLND